MILIYCTSALLLGVVGVCGGGGSLGIMNIFTVTTAHWFLGHTTRDHGAQEVRICFLRPVCPAKISHRVVSAPSLAALVLYSPSDKTLTQNEVYRMLIPTSSASYWMVLHDQNLYLITSTAWQLRVYQNVVHSSLLQPSF